MMGTFDAEVGARTVEGAAIVAGMQHCTDAFLSFFFMLHGRHCENCGNVVVVALRAC
jgi:hypothetical protein